MQKYECEQTDRKRYLVLVLIAEKILKFSNCSSIDVNINWGSTLVVNNSRITILTAPSIRRLIVIFMSFHEGNLTPLTCCDFPYK